MLKKSGLAPVNRGPVPPDITELHQVLSQALERRGQPVQTVWSSVDKLTTFTLTTTFNFKGGDPQWTLVSEYRGIKSPMFDYPSCDVLLVHNLIASSSAELANLGRIQSNMGNPLKRDDAPVKRDDAPVKRDDTSMKRDDASMKRDDTSMKRDDTPVKRDGNSSKHDEATLRITEPVQKMAKKAEATAPQVPTQGDLSRWPLDDLLKLIASAKSTGKLEVRSKTVLAVVYVQDGKPVDATASDAEGDDAIIEILTWREGQFTFEPRVLRNSHTVHQSVDALVSQSKQLSERSHFLKNAGMIESSILLPKRANLSEPEFMQKASPNAPMNLEFMSQFYRALDGTQTFESLLRSLQMGRIQLINLIYHLVSNDLVKISNESIKQQPFTVQPRVIDGAAIQAVMMSLRRVETGMFIYPAFLYFLEQEYFRCYRSRSPLSVIVFEMRMDGGNGQRQMLPGPAILDAVLRISQLKRHVDLLAHYDAYDYAMLLPNTKANGSQIFANRLVRALTASSLGGEVDPSKLILSMGCASIPEDFVDLSSLLGAADLAMDQARQQKKHVVLFRDIKPVSV